MATSRHFSAAQLSGLLKVGDVIIPGDEALPSFSASGALEHIDRMADYMSPGDRDGVKFLASLFRYLPTALVRGIMWVSEQQKVLPGPLGTAARLVNIGIKGVIMSLYYSDVGNGPSVHAIIGYDARIVEQPASHSASAGDRT